MFKAYDLTPLRNKVDVILRQSDVWVSYRWENPIDRSNVYIAKPGEAIVTSEPVELLQILYSLEKPLRQTFGPELFARITPKTASTIAHALLALGLWRDLDLSGLNEGRDFFWLSVATKLANESLLLSDDDLRLLRDQVALTELRFPQGPSGPGDPARQVRPAVRKVNEVIDRIGYERLRDTLRQVANPEINTDRQTVISRMEALGFVGAVAEALEEVERRLLVGATQFDFKPIFDSLRPRFLPHDQNSSCFR